MFGKIRASPSPVEWLELERFPSKIFKDDSLSIYEATLVKLKKGSSLQHNFSPESLDSMDLESNPTVSVESPQVSGLLNEQGLFACNSDNSCASVISSPNQVQKRGKEISIHSMFSKYASSHKEPGSTSSYNRGSSANVSAC